MVWWKYYIRLPLYRHKACTKVQAFCRFVEFLNNFNKRRWMRGMWVRIVIFAKDRLLGKSNKEVSIIERLKTRVI